MDCRDVQALIHAYADGEIDLVQSAEITLHLRSCSGCQTTFKNISTLRSALQESSLFTAAPSSLKLNIRHTLGLTRSIQFSRGAPFWRDWAIASSVALVLLFGWTMTRNDMASRDRRTIIQFIVENHIRSLQPNHLLDVPSTDQHTVKPWFEGKVDFAPVVPDLTTQGFLLLGGRLDYLGGKSVAVLVYKRRLHIINLYSWIPSEGDGTGLFSGSQQGYNIVSTNFRGLTYSAVSDLDAKELEAFITTLNK
jgi:anti-sigma factor RsiW